MSHPIKPVSLPDVDVKNLRGFRQLYDATFTKNLLANANVSCKLLKGKASDVIDGDYDTSVRPNMRSG